MSVVVKRSPISATAELLLNFAVCRDAARRAGPSATADTKYQLSLTNQLPYLNKNCLDMRADRQTPDRHTDMLIAILCTPLEGEVTAASVTFEKLRTVLEISYAFSTRRPASADRTVRRHVLPMGVGPFAFRYQGNGSNTLANILILLERQLIALQLCR